MSYPRRHWDPTDRETEDQVLKDEPDHMTINASNNGNIISGLVISSRPLSFHGSSFPSPHSVHTSWRKWKQFIWLVNDLMCYLSKDHAEEKIYKLESLAVILQNIWNGMILFLRLRWSFDIPSNHPDRATALCNFMVRYIFHTSGEKLHHPGEGMQVERSQGWLPCLVSATSWASSPKPWPALETILEDRALPL